MRMPLNLETGPTQRLATRGVADPDVFGELNL